MRFIYRFNRTRAVVKKGHYMTHLLSYDARRFLIQSLQNPPHHVVAPYILDTVPLQSTVHLHMYKMCPSFDI